MGGRDVVLLLRLKARVGDSDPRVTGEVLGALLQMEGQGAIFLAAEFLEDSDAEVADEAALALGGSRLAEAFELLQKAWHERAGFRAGGALLRAMSVSRLQKAFDFLIDLVKHGSMPDAEEALHALELQKSTEDIVERVEYAVAERAEPRLQAVFRQRFRA
jgi:hypothetical protein